MMTVPVCMQAVIAIALALVLYVGSRSLVDVLDAGLVTRRVDALRVYVRPHTHTHTRRDGQHQNIASTHCGSTLDHTPTHTHTDGQHRNIASTHCGSTSDHTPTHTHTDGQHRNIASTHCGSTSDHTHGHTHTQTDSTKT